MPSYAACRNTVVRASPQACFDALTDFESLPEWQSAVRDVRVLERDEQGRGHVVEYEIDARVTRVRYRLEQIYDEPRRIGSRYLGGDFADMAGEWRLLSVRGGTCAAFDLRIDPGRAVPRVVRRMVASLVVQGALRDLERHLTG
jgi:ribosome-associated toxin RatA of RatAB toxin-antitoxin module